MNEFRYNTINLRPSIFLFSVITLLFCLSCNTPVTGKNDFHTEERILKAFNSVVIDQKLNLTAHLTEAGEKNRIEFSAQANIIPLIITTVENEKLIISSAKSIDTTTIIDAHIYCSGPVQIENKGGGVLKFDPNYADQLKSAIEKVN